MDLPQFCSSKLTFHRLHRIIDSLFKELRVEGVGSSSNHHDPISNQDINQLLETGILGTKAPTQLLNAVSSLLACTAVSVEVKSIALFVFQISNPHQILACGPTLKELLRIDKVAF